MGNHLNRMNFELTNSDWTNSFKISAHNVETDLDADGDGRVEVNVSDRGDNSTRHARDVSWSVHSDGTSILEDHQGTWIKTYRSSSIDLNELLIYVNFAFLALNFGFFSKY